MVGLPTSGGTEKDLQLNFGLTVNAEFYLFHAGIYLFHAANIREIHQI